jgi:flagellar motor component MotA
MHTFVRILKKEGTKLLDEIVTVWQKLQTAKHLTLVGLEELKTYSVLDKATKSASVLEESKEDLLKQLFKLVTHNEEQKELKERLYELIEKFENILIRPVIVVNTNRVIPVEVHFITDPPVAVRPVSIVWGGGESNASASTRQSQGTL